MKNILYALALVVLFSACEEKIDLDLSYAGQKTVVEGRVTTETDSSYVRVSLTAPYNSNKPPQTITNAVVEMVKDNEPAVIFTHVGNGIYKPAAGYVGETNHNYSLKVVVDGKEYTSQSYLYPMFEIDTAITQEYKNADPVLDAGYAITIYTNYNQPPTKYYWFRYGRNDTLEEGDILFDNANIALNTVRPFELPFFRCQPKDSAMMIFRSIDVNVYNYLYALGNLTGGIPGLFQAPPANPPTNIKGDALGFFYASDVVRRGYIVK